MLTHLPLLCKKWVIPLRTHTGGVIPLLSHSGEVISLRTHTVLMIHIFPLNRFLTRFATGPSARGQGLRPFAPCICKFGRGVTPTCLSNIRQIAGEERGKNVENSLKIQVKNRQIVGLTKTLIS